LERAAAYVTMHIVKWSLLDFWGEEAASRAPVSVCLILHILRWTDYRIQCAAQRGNSLTFIPMVGIFLTVRKLHISG